MPDLTPEPAASSPAAAASPAAPAPAAPAATNPETPSTATQAAAAAPATIAAAPRDAEAQAARAEEAQAPAADGPADEVRVDADVKKADDVKKPEVKKEADVKEAEAKQPVEVTENSSAAEPEPARRPADNDQEADQPKGDKSDDKSKEEDKPKEGDKPAKAKASTLVKAAQNYVTEQFASISPKLTYHSLAHTEAVVKECRALAPAASLGPDDTEALLVAAWFHDLGYLDVYDGHEFRSMERAAAWLGEQGVPAQLRQQVDGLIKATHRDSKPATELEKMLVDADMSNLAREDYRSRAELLRTEWELVLDKSYSTQEWAELQLNFMLAHKYLSDAGKDRYRKDLKKNIDDQRDYVKKKEKKEKKKKQEEGATYAEPKRGVETMFRAMYGTHVKLSAMADKKASMMIQLNAVLISVIITYLGAKMGKAGAFGPLMNNNPVLTIPVGILLATALGSVTTAILSAQPDVTSFDWLKRSPEIATNRRVNLLFFGQFTKISLDNFQSGMHEMMRNKEAIYTNMLTDVYYLGEVLTRKYRLLRASYTIFMVGIILTALSFGIALLYKS